MTIRLVLSGAAVAFLALLPQEACADWVQTAGPFRGNTRAFAASGDTVFAANDRDGVSLSTDGGSHWTTIGSGLLNANIRSLAVGDSFVFAGNYFGGIFRSPKRGPYIWDSVGIPGENGIGWIGVSGATVFTEGYLSTDNGATWTPLDTGEKYFSAYFAKSNGDLLGGNDRGIFILDKSGRSWNRVGQPLPVSEPTIYSLAWHGGTMFAGAFGGVFRSTDNGAHWSVSNSGLVNVTAIVALGDTVFAGTALNDPPAGGIFQSTDNGSNWTRVKSTFDKRDINALAVANGTILVGTDTFGIVQLRKYDMGWSAAVVGPNCYISSIVAAAGAIVAGTNFGIFQSLDSGSCWNQVDSGFSDPHVDALAVSGPGDIIAGTDAGIYRRAHDGLRWSQVHDDSVVQCIIVRDSTVFAGSYSKDMVRSLDCGKTWEKKNTGMEKSYPLALTFCGGAVFVATYFKGVLRSTDNGETWIPVNSGLPSGKLFSFAAIGATILVCVSDEGVYCSNDNGATWNASGAGIPTKSVGRFAVVDSSVFVSTDNGVYRSNDKGANWAVVSTGHPKLVFNGFAVSGGTVFGSTGDAGVWLRPLSELKQAATARAPTLKARLHPDLSIIPNRAEGLVTIEYYLPAPQHASFAVYDMSGKQKVPFIEGEHSAGVHIVTWNSRGLSAGCYFVGMRAGSEFLLKKMMLVR